MVYKCKLNKVILNLHAFEWYQGLSMVQVSRFTAVYKIAFINQPILTY